MKADDMRVTREATIRNAYGLHARPAAEFVKLANRFKAEVWLAKEDLEVSGKSIMGVMMLAAEKGSKVTILTRGEDAEVAAEALRELVENGFGEARR
jgi:phosphocarrier protein HPr